MKRRIYIPQGCDQQGRVQDGQWLEFDDSQPPDEPMQQSDSGLLFFTLAIAAGAVIGFCWWVREML